MAKGTCSVEGCERPMWARSFCTMHYQRWKRTGDPTVTVGTPHGLTPMERFMRFVKVDPLTGCWVWTGNTDGRYGRFSPAGRKDSNAMAHCWIYEQTVGPIPEGMQLDHFVCDRMICANPEHVRPATARENILRSSSPPALNLAKTHCLRGHPFSGANLAILADGERRCRTCVNERARRYRRKS